MLLARVAVASAWQTRAIGAGLLIDAMRRTLQAADIAGIRAFVVQAKDDVARAFYEHYGFVPTRTDLLHLYASASRQSLREMPRDQLPASSARLIPRFSAWETNPSSIGLNNRPMTRA
jgi:N-acetylglutamate synthase-like GNAT family acetyltransferase